MGTLVQNLRYSVRLLSKSAVFTLAVVGTLALGIGLNIAAFSAIREGERQGEMGRQALRSDPDAASHEAVSHEPGPIRAPVHHW